MSFTSLWQCFDPQKAPSLSKFEFYSIYTVFGPPTIYTYCILTNTYCILPLLPIKESLPLCILEDIASFCSCHAPLLCIKYPRFPLNLAWASPPSLEGQTLEPLVKRILSPPSPRWTYSLSFFLEPHISSRRTSTQPSLLFRGGKLCPSRPCMCSKL